MTPLDIVKQTSGPMGLLGQAFYFHSDTLAKGKELGLDGFRFYVIGRGGVLGDVEAPVVTSAFAYFHPAVIDKIWTSAKAKVGPREAASVYGMCCAELGRAHFGDLDLAAFIDAAEAIVAAADPAGLSLFAGWSAEPLVADEAGRAMQLAAVLRELRGSAHIIAIRAAGLSAAIAHAIKRPDDTGTFGWDPAPEASDEHRAQHLSAEDLTDQLLVPSYATLSTSQGEALVAGTESMTAAMN